MPARRSTGRSTSASSPSNGGGWQPAASPEPPQPGSGQQAVSGLLETSQEPGGYLRTEALQSQNDPFVPQPLIHSLGLRPGDLIEGLAARGQRGRVVQSIWRVNGHGVDHLAERPAFDRLTAVHPDQILRLGTSPTAITGRLLDLVAPVGRGQRGLIVSPPKAGKTTVLKDIAAGVSADEKIRLLVLLIGERPEEVTELRRALQGEVYGADLDAPIAAHARVARLGVERARRLAEEGHDVVVLLDSITRLARAHNLSARGGGRTLTGGMDAAALQPARQAFGAARCLEEGSSVTVLATCLVDTGSRLDDLVYEEFKGTGNMEVHLDRKLAERRIFPAVNIIRSGTRHEELLLDARTLDQVARLRRRISRMTPEDGLALVLEALARYPTNAEALDSLVR